MIRPQSWTPEFFDRDQAGFRVHFDFGELHAAGVIGGKALLPLAVHHERIDTRAFCTRQTSFHRARRRCRIASAIAASARVQMS
jgi:hypothetical protein